MMMLNEAARCFDERVFAAPAMVISAPYLALVFRRFLAARSAMDTLGAGGGRRDIAAPGCSVRPRFTPCDTLLHMAEQGATFWPAEERTT